jgi:hypothetical protein
MTFVLIIYAWTISMHAGSGIATAEFSSEEKCQAAAKASAGEFNGFYSKMYWVCVQK